MIYRFEIPLTPVAKGRARFNCVTKRSYTPAKTRKAEQDMRFFMDRQWNMYKQTSPLEGPIAVHVNFFFMRPKSVTEKNRPRHCVKPDASNLLKALEDAGNGLIWRDDSQIDHVLITKAYSVQPYIILLVSDEL